MINSFLVKQQKKGYLDCVPGLSVYKVENHRRRSQRKGKLPILNPVVCPLRCSLNSPSHLHVL